MESTEELQQQEITALKSIYADDFIQPPPPKAWKAAQRLHEFIINVRYLDLEHADKVWFSLHVKFPKTYPSLACPIFTIQKPVNGLTNDHVNKLSALIHGEAQKCKGSEMVFQIVTFAQEWMSDNVSPPQEVGSLALEMSKRASQEEQQRKERLAQLGRLEEERLRRETEALNEQIRIDSEMRQRNRNRANSAATEVPWGRSLEDELLLDDNTNSELDIGEIERFDAPVTVDGVRFDRVRLVRPRKDGFATVYVADPICDVQNVRLSLEAHVVVFDSSYYASTQGRKKLKLVEAELQKLTTLHHPNLISIYAVTTTFVGGHGRLVILAEEFPSLSLADVLLEFEKMREEKVSEYLTQILAALNVVHAADLVHRGINPRCIGLASKESVTSSSSSDSSRTIVSLSRPTSRSKHVKLGKVAYWTRLVDLQRSNPFEMDADTTLKMEKFDFAMLNGEDQYSEGSDIPDSWQCRDAMDSPLSYTRGRDLHSLGIVLLKMLLGNDITERFENAQEALINSDISPVLHQQSTLMLSSGTTNAVGKKNQKHVSCLSLLADLAQTSFHGTKRSPVITFRERDPKTPTVNNFAASPETDYFRTAMTARTRQASRWKEDWEELELLGKGAFGSVVKARNKIDSRIYAVKKIRLKTLQNDTKIYREVNALSRLSHRFIVRYYTTWVEKSDDPGSTATSDDDSYSDSNDASMLTSVPRQSRSFSGNGISIDLSELDDVGSSGTGGTSGGASFPSIHFTTRENDDDSSDSEDDTDAENGMNDLFETNRSGNFTPPIPVSRTMYIQMEFVERQTLRERIAEGISEDEAWRLFQQVLDALVHMSALGILHRDIKLTNIFIDGKGDCKGEDMNQGGVNRDLSELDFGDFGLATSSLAAVDPSDVSPHVMTSDDITLEVGTRLYIAPEVQSRKRGPRNHSKADLYSLGIVFFEMNYMFSTGAERIAVIEDLRKPEIYFPPTWDARRDRQRNSDAAVIKMMLQHSPDARPSAMELSQSPLLPSGLEDEYFKGALKMMVKQNSVHHQALLSALFTEPPQAVRAYLYDSEPDHHPEQASFNGVIHEQLAGIFRLHGAIDMEPPLLMPLNDIEEEKSHATLIDRHGDIVLLPRDSLVPFARLAARAGHRRIKRYHLSDTYRASSIAGHPRPIKSAIFDIITPDMELGHIASGAEILTMINELLSSFPNLSSNYEIHVSHSTIIDLALQRIPAHHRNHALDIMTQTKSSPSQKRALLAKLGLLRSVTDEIEVLASSDEDIDGMLARIEKMAPTFSTAIFPIVEEIKKTLKFAGYAGFSRQVYFTPLLVGNFHTLFKDGVLFVVARKNKRTDYLAVGGRYDNLIARFSPVNPKESICAMALQISVEKIINSVVDYQMSAVSALVKEQRSFGYWSPRRCDVYVVSYHPGYLQDRLEVVALLWNHGISADLMYESGLPDMDVENFAEACAREGILFTVYPRPRTLRRDQPAFKVKSILKGTEYEVSRHDLVAWLQHQIIEQKRVDAQTSGAPILSDHHCQVNTIAKDASATSNIQLLIPMDTKKQRKHIKQMFLDRAFDTVEQIKSSFQAGIPVLAVDVPPPVFDSMTRGAGWITDDEQWKPIAAGFLAQHLAYASQIREAAAKKKAEGVVVLLLFAVKEERTQLLSL